MFDFLSRSTDRRADALTRLTQVATRAPDAAPEAEPRWVEVPASSGDPTDDVPAAVPRRAEPWWRRGRAGQVVERWVPGGPPDGSAPLRKVPVAAPVAVVVVLVAVVGGAMIFSGAPEPEEPPALPAAATASAPSAPTTPTGTTMVVSVVGKVTAPGLVTLPEGARVADALRACGGEVPGTDLTGLNLARKLSDGEQVAVGVLPPPGAEQGAGAEPGATAPVDLNTATLAQLDTLPGVGAVTAKSIVDWRAEHGRFAKVEQLRDVDGIGPSRFDRLKDLVVVR